MAKTYQYAVEDYRDVEHELAALWEEHRDEVGADKGLFELAPDSDRYREAARTGVAHLVVCRYDGVVIGYHCCFVRPHLHYKHSLTAFTDVFFIKKEYRIGRVGIRLFKYVEETLEQRGVQRIYTGTKLSLDIGAILSHMGYNPIERIYTKVLRSNCEKTY